MRKRRAASWPRPTSIDEKLDFAKSFGADLAVRADGDVPGRVTEFFGRKADVVMLCASALPAVEQAWKCVDKGGAIVFFAVPGPEKTVTIPVNDFWTKEVRVLTSYYCGPPDIQEAMGLLAAGAIDVERLITHRLPLEETARGFALVMAGDTAIKVIIKPRGVSD